MNGYSLDDIALMTGITQRTLRKHVASGALKGAKTAGKWRFTPEEAGAFMDRPEIRKLSAQHRRAKVGLLSANPVASRPCRSN